MFTSICAGASWVRLGASLAAPSAKIVLNARENVVQSYVRRGYAVTGWAETLFGMIRHRRMGKVF
jgi:hypothetical protein